MLVSPTVSRLLSDAGTLYGLAPREIAKLVEAKLNELSKDGEEILSISALPDFHNWGEDGGVKDIFFLHTLAEVRSQPKIWTVATLLPDSQTMHGMQSDFIMRAIAKYVADISRLGQVKHLIMLTDHHASATSSGIGGYDGVKNVLIVLHF